ncbi:hypothetical protein ACP26L_34820 [Paenibacillus sp. S-38]|uniref:hypothetical protein n=1 Tax=Paenibacillus sp. S-38 TaxID=3416710 RepID=UPI003CF7C95E
MLQGLGLEQRSEGETVPLRMYAALDDPELEGKLERVSRETPFFSMYLEVVHGGETVMDSRMESLELWADLAGVLEGLKDSGSGETLCGHGPHFLKLQSLDGARLLYEVGPPSQVDPQLRELIRSDPSTAELARDEGALYARLYGRQAPIYSRVFPEEAFFLEAVREGELYFERMMKLGFYSDGYGESSLRVFRSIASR